MSNKLNIPKISGGLFEYPKDFFKEALSFEFPSYADEKEYSDIVNGLFFNGGKIPVGGGIDKEYQSRGIAMLKAIIVSFEPKHEEKVRVCAAILFNLK